MRIFSPSEGIIWFAGEYRTIFWRRAYIPPPADPPTVNITLRRAGNKTWRMPLAVNYKNAEQAKFVWKIPADLPPANDYVVRIIPNRANGAGRPNIRASNSKPFTVAQPTESRKPSITYCFIDS